MADEDLDFSNMEESDEIDWSDVESELQQNREMIKSEASGGDSEGDGLPADFGGAEVSAPEDVGIEFLMDIPLMLRVEAGSTRMLIKDLLLLDIGSIIELAKDVGEAMDILINEKKVATGQIVVQHEKFALKITEIIDQNERIAKLKGR